MQKNKAPDSSVNRLFTSGVVHGIRGCEFAILIVRAAPQFNLGVFVCLIIKANNIIKRVIV
jgi:hypothetical protein